LPLAIQLAGTPQANAQALMVVRRGEPWPFSALLTGDRVTPMRSANSSCSKPAYSRAMRKRWRTSI
jgi:hypothetical protein